jgi:hypothetical protein
VSLSNSPRPQFTRSDAAEIAAAHAREDDFKTFLLDRFVAYTHTDGAHNVAGIVISPVDEPTAADNGWAEWSLSPLWVDEITKGRAVTFVKRLRNGVTPQKRDAEVCVSLDFIFSADETDDDRDAVYAKRVRTRTGQRHAQYVFVQAYGPQWGKPFAEWQDAGCPRGPAADAYRTAHRSLMAHPGDLKDVRRQVMDAAQYLCLNAL